MFRPFVATTRGRSLGIADLLLMPIERCRVFYSGRVQGVGFRMTAQRVARSFGVSGFAMNLPDGRVEVQVQGEPDRIASFLQALGREMASNIDEADRTRFDPDPDLAGAFEIRR